MCDKMLVDTVVVRRMDNNEHICMMYIYHKYTYIIYSHTSTMVARFTGLNSLFSDTSNIRLQ